MSELGAADRPPPPIPSDGADAGRSVENAADRAPAFDDVDEYDPVGDLAPTENELTETDIENPGENKGALGDAFEPGVVDDDGNFTDEERAIADRLAADGAMVHSRKERLDSNASNPDSMVRRSPEDEGTVTEFKVPHSGSPNALARHIHHGAKQVNDHGGGDVVIDGRSPGLTQNQAEAGYRRAEVSERDLGKPMPDRVHFVLGDGTIYTRPKEGSG